MGCCILGATCPCRIPSACEVMRVDKDGMEDVIASAQVCRLAMADEDGPYVVPLCFGYQDGVLYFHGGSDGRKLDILRRNPRVCFEFDVDVAVRRGKEPCKSSVTYRSVVGFGTASFVKERGEKRRALGVIMRQYAEGDFTFPDPAVDRTTVFRVEVQSMTGGQSG